MRSMFELQMKNRKKSADFMFMLGLSNALDQLAIANSGCWYGHVLRREDGHMLKMALDIEVEGQRKKGSPKRT